MLAFVAGALIPLLAIAFAPDGLRLPVTLAAVCLALLLTGWTSARLGNAAAGPAMARNLVVGSLTMALSYAVGTLVGGLLP
jgi:VIT1/CCC1 family predicted Fe2+/Mn2+ transporter